jgi:hypothetical protein
VLPEIDPRDTALAEAVAGVTRRLIIAHRCGDGQEAASALAQLLRAVAAYTNTLAERPGDSALRRAVAR